MKEPNYLDLRDGGLIPRDPDTMAKALAYLLFLLGMTVSAAILMVFYVLYLGAQAVIMGGMM